MNFTNFFRIAFQQKSFGVLLLNVCEICKHWCLHFPLFKKTLLKNYLIIFEHVYKLSKKNEYLRKILDLDLKLFGLQIPIMLHFIYWIWIWTGNQDFGQQFIIILIRYFTGIGLKILGLQIWITIIVFYGIWALKYLDYRFGFRLLLILLD